jgi:hypothetical protein
MGWRSAGEGLCLEPQRSHAMRRGEPGRWREAAEAYRQAQPR